VKVLYSEMDVSGFPFTHKVTFFQPRLVFSTSKASVQIVAAYLSLERMDDKPGDEYIIDFARDVTASVRFNGGQQENYYIHFSDVPKLLTHIQVTNKDRQLDEYGIMMQDPITLSIQIEEELRTVTLPIIQSEEPIWGFIPKDIEIPLMQMVVFLQSALREQAPASRMMQ